MNSFVPAHFLYLRSLVTKFQVLSSQRVHSLQDTEINVCLFVCAQDSRSYPENHVILQKPASSRFVFETMKLVGSLRPYC
jgi:hypothetical protein